MTCAIHLPNVKHIRSNIMKIKVPGYVTSKGSIMSRAFGWLGSFYEGGGKAILTRCNSELQNVVLLGSVWLGWLTVQN